MLGADESNQLIGTQARSVTTLEDELGRQAQALIDLSHCEAAGVSLVHVPSRAQELELSRALLESARERGFVSAHLSLSENPVDAIDALVCALLDALVVPGDRKVGGLLRLLQAYSEKSRALSRFDEAVEEHGLAGDLVALSRAYLSAEDDATREIEALTLWATGTLPQGKRAIPGVRGVLDVHTGQRVFGELTRLIRALGHKGLVVILSAGESIAGRTARQREKAYTLLRELVDNFDSGRGAVATRVTITGGDALFVGENSLQELPPLYARLQLPSSAEPPPPHRSWTSLVKDPYEYVHRPVKKHKDVKPESLRSLIRLSQGLPPIDALTQMSVGHERVDKSIDKLFHHASMAGSVFQVLSGEYGSGKTHILLHLAERALAEGHPVFWLNLERMNLDLGNPARHLGRVLAQSILPTRGRPSALDRLSVWTRSAKKVNRLKAVLLQIAEEDAEEAKAARKALQLSSESGDEGAALEEFLSARDLTNKAGSSGYRQDAYRRLLLWTRLLAVMEGAEGPVVLIDEAENLYTSGVAEHARRSALRTLSFYCGGALPGACVILAMTPPALREMRKESGSLLKQAGEVESTLDLEDVDLFRRRLLKLSPDEVPAFSQSMKKELAEKVRSFHRQVRGPIVFAEWEEAVSEQVRKAGLPRALTRSLLDQLEAAWWSGAK